MDLGTESRAPIFTLSKSATASLITIRGQGAVFCFTQSVWWHCLDTTPGVQQQITHRHSRYHLHSVQKFSVQLQILPHLARLLNTGLEQQTMKYLEGINEADIC